MRPLRVSRTIRGLHGQHNLQRIALGGKTESVMFVIYRKAHRQKAFRCKVVVFGERTYGGKRLARDRLGILPWNSSQKYSMAWSRMSWICSSKEWNWLTMKDRTTSFVMAWNLLKQKVEMADYERSTKELHLFLCTFNCYLQMLENQIHQTKSSPVCGGKKKEP